MEQKKQTTNHYQSWLESGLSRNDYSQKTGISKEAIYYWQRKTVGYRLRSSKSIKSIPKESDWLEIPLEEEENLILFQPRIELSITKDWEIVFRIRFL